MADWYDGLSFEQVEAKIAEMRLCPGDVIHVPDGYLEWSRRRPAMWRVSPTDTERLDWLEANASVISFVGGVAIFVRSDEGESIRQVIDAAMAECDVPDGSGDE